jgi:hypothetical protein
VGTHPITTAIIAMITIVIKNISVAAVSAGEKRKTYVLVGNKTPTAR